MTICDRFDVVVVLFPFTGRARAKPRPALVLSRRNFNAAHGASVLTMITTASHTRWPSDIAIEDAASAGLSSASVVRLKLFTLDNEIIDRQIGHLRRTDARRVQTAVARCLG
jgi:mRNA interferase MazF